MSYQRSFARVEPRRFSRTFLLLLFFFLFIFSVSSQGAQAGQATLAWDACTGSGLAGYKVYVGSASRSYQSSLDAGNKTSATVKNLQEGSTYYFAVTAYDSSRKESGYSNEVVYTVPAACAYSVSPVSRSFNASGGTGSAAVTAATGCAWTAASNVSWILLTSNGSATGSGTANYTVAANSGTSARTGTLTVAGKTVTVTQTGTSATAQYSLSITKAGTGSGAVTNSPSGSVFKAGTSVTLTASPAADSTFAGWSGACAGTSPTCTLTLNANAAVTAAFNLKSGTGGTGTNSCTITAKSGTNGTISPKGTLAVARGASQSFKITPNSRYKIASVKVDGVSVGAVASYSFTNVTGNHTITATFDRKNSWSLR